MRSFLLVALLLVASALSGCGTLFASGPRTSVERVLTMTKDIDEQLTPKTNERTPANQPMILSQAPLARMKVTSAFKGRNRSSHQGVDLDARRGTPIAAASDGIVVYAGEGMRGYGLTVIVRHGNSIATLYAHADELTVSVGDKVVAGQTLGYVGSTGNASGPHLHFEVRRDTAAVDPMKHLPKP